MKQISREGYDARTLKIMMSKPITSISRYIGAKWYLPLKDLSVKAGVPIKAVMGAINGEKISPAHEERLRRYLDKL